MNPIRREGAGTYQAGATKDEIIGAVVMNLHLTGLVTVPEYQPSALEGIEEATKVKSNTAVSRSVAKKPKPAKKLVKR